MNAKEEIIRILNGRLKYHEYHENNLLVKETEALIAATEAAIFDVPSEEEIDKERKIRSIKSNNTPYFKAGCNFILNYKPESDGK